MAVSACSNRLPSFEFVGDTFLVSALIGLENLTFDFLISNLVRVIARRVGNLSTNFGVLELFDLNVWAKNCQTDHVTLQP